MLSIVQQKFGVSYDTTSINDCQDSIAVWIMALCLWAYHLLLHSTAAFNEDDMNFNSCVFCNDGVIVSVSGC